MAKDNEVTITEKIQVFDNFLSDYEFGQLKTLMMGETFPWYFNDGIVAYNDSNYQFTHAFYHNDSYGNLDNPNFSFVEPCVRRLGVTRLVRVKANLNHRTLFHRNGGFHVDYNNLHTAILYINTNNGWTKFKGGGKIKCVENRMVIFDSNIQHAGFTCTDKKRKVVVNFNYGTN